MIRKHKSIIMVTALILFFTGAFLLENVYAQNRTEKQVQAASKKTVLETDSTQTGSAENAKESGQQAEQMEVSRQMAQDILEEMSDAPLLQENAKDDYGNSSLEICINDVNATTGAKDVILRICKEAGIDADKAKVSDLTVDQIAQIDQEVYNNSSHPKD